MFCSSVDQAEKELSHDWTLLRSGNHGVPTTIEWLNDVLPSGSRVGIDPVSFCFVLCSLSPYGLLTITALTKICEMIILPA